MRIVKFGLIEFVFILFSTSAYAENKVSRKIDFLSSEYVVCASYFKILAIGLETKRETKGSGLVFCFFRIVVLE